MPILEGFAKITTPLIAGLGIWAGIWQFQEQQSFSESQEFKRKMWDKKLSAYTSLADVTSQLMISDGGLEFDSLGRCFQRLHYSSSPLFDSVAVLRMTSFDEEIKSVLNNEGGDMNRLRERGNIMLKSCQLSIDSSYIRASRSGFSFFKRN